MKPTSIKPETNIDAPATSIDEYSIASLVRKITPPAKPKAESIASTSPKLITIACNDDDFATADNATVMLVSVLSGPAKVVSLAMAMKKPTSAIAMPIKWYLLNLSLRNALAKTTIITISSGPAIRTSFDAPILLMESYHVKIPNERDKDARITFFHDLEKRTSNFSALLSTQTATTNNNIPAKVMLIAESIMGEKCTNEVVKYSMIIDSRDIVIA